MLKILKLLLCAAALESAAPCFGGDIKASKEPIADTLQTAEAKIAKFKEILTTEKKAPLVELHKYFVQENNNYALTGFHHPPFWVEHKVAYAGKGVYLFYHHRTKEKRKSAIEEIIQIHDHHGRKSAIHAFGIWNSRSFLSPEVWFYTVTLTEKMPDFTTFCLADLCLQSKPKPSFKLTEEKLQTYIMHPLMDHFLKYDSTKASEYLQQSTHIGKFRQIAESDEQNSEIDPNKCAVISTHKLSGQPSILYDTKTNTFLVEFYAYSDPVNMYTEQMKQIVAHINHYNLSNPTVIAMFTIGILNVVYYGDVWQFTLHTDAASSAQIQVKQTKQKRSYISHQLEKEMNRLRDEMFKHFELELVVEDVSTEEEAAQTFQSETEFIEGFANSETPWATIAKQAESLLATNADFGTGWPISEDDQLLYVTKHHLYFIEYDVKKFKQHGLTWLIAHEKGNSFNAVLSLKFGEYRSPIARLVSVVNCKISLVKEFSTFLNNATFYELEKLIEKDFQKALKK